MILKDLIVKLRELEDEHGDIEVTCLDSNSCDGPVEEISTHIRMDGSVYEISLHP